MNAKFIAVLLSVFIAIFPLHASSNPPQEASIKSSSEIQNKRSLRINLNKADVNTLTGSYKGIGKKRAQAIVDWRKEHTRFNRIEDLAQVKGLGKVFVSKNLAGLKEIFIVE